MGDLLTLPCGTLYDYVIIFPATPEGVGGGPCTPGHYCVEGSVTETPCDAGYYQPSHRATNITWCIIVSQ